MVQAVQIPTTSRRSFLGTLSIGAVAIVPTALCTLPATPAPAVIRPEWAALEAEVIAASNAYEDATEQAADAAVSFAAWERTNPFPELGDWPEGDKLAEKATVAIHEAALGERYKRKIAEMRRCRLGAKQAEMNAARKRHRDACDKIAEIDAFTMDDLIFKARMAEHNSIDNWIAGSIPYDLLAIAEAKSLSAI